MIRTKCIRACVALLSFACCLALFSLSAFAGYQFEPNVRVDDCTNIYRQQNDPSVAVDLRNGTIYAVFEDGRVAGGMDIHCSKSTDGGANFEANVRVNDHTSLWNHQYDPIVAVDENGVVYVVFEDERNADGIHDIYFAKSTDGGASFGANVKVNDDPTRHRRQYDPSIAVHDGNIYVVWEDDRDHPGIYDVYFTRSTDGGVTFEANVRLNDNSTWWIQQYDPVIAVDKDGNIYVAFEDGRDRAGHYSIYFTKSTDGGTTFSPNIKVDDCTNNLADQHDPCIAAHESGNVYIAFEDERNRYGDYDIYFARSIDGGETFSPNVRVDDNTNTYRSQYDPSIAVDGSGDVYVVFGDRRRTAPDLDIYFARSIDAGATFLPNVKVDDSSISWNDQYDPSIAISQSGDVYVAFEDERNLNGFRDIYLAKAAMPARPGKPDPISPADNESVGSFTPQFEWSVFQDGGDYDIQAGYQLNVILSDDRIVYDTGLIPDASSSSHAYDPGSYTGVDPVTGVTMVSEALVENEEYYWQARYRDSGGQWSGWSTDVSGGAQTFSVSSNTDPVLLPIGNQQGRTNELFTIIPIEALDDDGDTLTIQATNLPQGAELFYKVSEPGYVKCSVRWPEPVADTYTVTFLVSDGRNGTDQETITITIEAVNHDPVLHPISNQQGSTGELFVISPIEASDIDGDNLTISVTGLPAEAGMFVVTSSAGYVKYRLRWPDPAANTYTATFTASDGRNGTDQETITITIEAVNHDPVLHPISNQQGSTGELFVISPIEASDIDGDNLTISVTGLPAEAGMFVVTSSAGYVKYRLRWPDPAANTYTATFSVSDGTTGTASETITITIQP